MSKKAKSQSRTATNFELSRPAATGFCKDCSALLLKKLEITREPSELLWTVISKLLHAVINVEQHISWTRGSSESSAWRSLARDSDDTPF
jgi:hypothetical protein